MNEKKYYIYLTTNLVNNKKYIGKHYGLIDDSYIGSGTAFLRAVEKYGKENFKKEILYISQDLEENNKKEKEFIKAFNACEDNNFYNISEGGDGGDIFHKLPLEQQELLREKAKKRNSGVNNPMYGKHHTEETKEKIRKIDKSYTQTKEFRQKMSEVMKGRQNGMYGKHHSEESKRKMSKNSKGKTAGEKNGMYGKTGNNALNGKYIGMYDENYNLIQIWKSKKAALEFLGLKGHTQLDKAIKNQTLYKGYFWKNEIKSVETK